MEGIEALSSALYGLEVLMTDSEYEPGSPTEEKILSQLILDRAKSLRIPKPKPYVCPWERRRKSKTIFLPQRKAPVRKTWLMS